MLQGGSNLGGGLKGGGWLPYALPFEHGFTKVWPMYTMFVFMYVHVCMYVYDEGRREKEQKAFERCYLETKPSSQHCLGQTKQINRQPLLLLASLVSSYPLRLFLLLLACPLILCAAFAPWPRRPTPFGYLPKRALPLLIYRVQLPTPVHYLSHPKRSAKRLPKRDQDFQVSLLPSRRCYPSR